MIDEGFSSCWAPPDRAEKAGAKAAANRMRKDHDIVDMLQEEMAPDVRLVNELLNAPDQNARRKLLEENRSMLSRDFVEALRQLEDDFRARQATCDVADRLKVDPGAGVVDALGSGGRRHRRNRVSLRNSVSDPCQNQSVQAPRQQSSMLPWRLFYPFLIQEESTTMTTLAAEIVTSGTEILLGDIVDTNAAWIAQQLREAGVNLYYKTTVGDNERACAASSSWRMTQPGHHHHRRPGPTVDDITRQAIANATGCPLRLHEGLATLKERFARFGATMTDNNRQQAMIPDGAILIENPVGTAPASSSRASVRRSSPRPASRADETTDDRHGAALLAAAHGRRDGHPPPHPAHLRHRRERDRRHAR